MHVRRLCVGLCLAAATSAAGFAQHVSPDDIIGGPLSGPMPFVNAPFSADAITTVSHTLRNGTRLEQSTTARYYRDSAGRVRVELLMEGLRAPKTMSERHMRLTVYPMTVVHPPARWRVGYTLDPVTRTVRYTGRGTRPLSSGGRSLGVPIGGVRYVHFTRAQDVLRREPHVVGDTIQRESLGTRRIAGVETTGQRTTVTFPAWLRRNPTPIDLVDEQWESPELGLIIYARYSDSNGGVIEYRLTNVRRGDPPLDLFVVPSDYTLDSPAGSLEDPIYASQDGRWVFDSLAWSVER
jgi:hypothetical protein